MLRKSTGLAKKVLLYKIDDFEIQLYNFLKHSTEFKLIDNIKILIKT